MALQHHFNNIRLYIFKNILSSRFPRPICAANKFPKSRTTVIFARGYPIHGFFQILLLEHQKWVFPGVSRASFRISFNQTDWKCCRGKRISRTCVDSAEREREKGRADYCVSCNLNENPLSLFSRHGGTGSKMSGEITRQSRVECRHVKNWSLDREKWTIRNWSEWTV